MSGHGPQLHSSSQQQVLPRQAAVLNQHQAPMAWISLGPAAAAVRASELQAASTAASKDSNRTNMRRQSLVSELHSAAAAGNSSRVQQLLEAGVDVDCADPWAKQLCIMQQHMAIGES